MKKNKLFEAVLDLLFPKKCVFCGQIADYSPCPRCKDKLPELHGKVEHKEFFSKCTAPFRYEGIVRDSILRYKFTGKSFYAREYAKFVADAARNELDTYDIISWPPVSKMRRRSRGFDQAEMLARKTAEELSAPVKPLLRKIRNTPKQSGISDPAKRRANVLGAYAVIDKNEVKGKKILLIDDIITTGATLSECARELLLSGAADVQCATIAVAKHGKKG